ncbi:MAG: hypothetical protein HQL38_13935 [Alphaproteobacteria bacterium]|nr:hypothetical protein [Alphaproteobacteria bacterium]
MTIARRFFAVFSVSLLLIPPSGAGADRSLTLGVLAWRGVPETATRWQPLADHLSAALDGRPIRLVAADFLVTAGWS